MSGTAIGRNICHIWYEDEKKVIYNGKIEKIKKKIQDTYVVAYWNKEEDYNDAIDYDIPKVQLACDIIGGDLMMA